MNSTETMQDLTNKAKKAAAVLNTMSREKKDEILHSMADMLIKDKSTIREANNADLKNAEEKGRNKAFIDRLTLDEDRINSMSQMLKDVAFLDDPVGKVLEEITRPNGLIIKKVRVPIGVIGIIYEARPNVTAECVSLCLKSGNAVILRGGSDSINSNKAIYDVLKKAVSACGIEDDLFVLIEDTSRELVDAMLKASGGIDLIMPRGGESLIKEVVENSRVPVIKHYKGICHIYVDAEADLKMAGGICLNAKIQRPGVCNAMETMLVNEAIAGVFLPEIADKLIASGVKIKGCKKTKELLGDKTESASKEDYQTEWLDLVLNIRIVDSVDAAIEHISEFGSDHSDAIITKNQIAAEEFTKRVDSATVYVNASTRFTDGGEFGKGAEIGISTDKIHARGPMGLEELTTYKYVIYGKGQIRE